MKRKKSRYKKSQKQLSRNNGNLRMASYVIFVLDAYKSCPHVEKLHTYCILSTRHECYRDINIMKFIFICTCTFLLMWCRKCICLDSLERIYDWPWRDISRTCYAHYHCQVVRKHKNWYTHVMYARNKYIYRYS